MVNSILRISVSIFLFDIVMFLYLEVYRIEIKLDFGLMWCFLMIGIKYWESCLLYYKECVCVLGV